MPTILPLVVNANIPATVAAEQWLFFAWAATELSKQSTVTIMIVGLFLATIGLLLIERAARVFRHIYAGYNPLS
jgi:hypothetical protein